MSAAVLRFTYSANPSCAPDTVVQSHRFDVFEDIGCQPEIPAVSAGTVFFWLPALVLTLFSLFLCRKSRFRLPSRC